MFFTTIDHYNYELLSDTDYTANEINDCFICYEIKLDDTYKTMQLNAQKDYYKKCMCNGWVHERCLYKWYDKSNKCPICRIPVIKKQPISRLLFIPYNFYAFWTIYTLRNINRTVQLCILLLFIYYSSLAYIKLADKRQIYRYYENDYYYNSYNTHRKYDKYNYLVMPILRNETNIYKVYV